LEAIKELSRVKKRVVFTVHNWRHSPVIQEVSRLLAAKDEDGQGRLGRIRRVRYEVIRMRPSVAVGEGPGQTGGPDDNWRLDPAVAGGGILVDHGWHAFYIVNGWLGGEPKWVEGRLENRKFKEIAVEDTAEVIFGYPDGAVAELFFTWAGGERRNSIAIEADGGRRMLVLDDHIVCEETGPGGCGRKVLKSFSEGLSHGSHHPDWYGAVVQEFLDEVQGRTTPGKNFTQAASCLKMLLGAAEAAKSGRRVEL
jgi:predicted dehydrogenase